MKDVVALRLARSLASPRGSRWVGLALLLMGTFLGVGCSGGPKEAKDSVSGKVTLNDQAVSGIVTFRYDDGKELTSPTAMDGTYKIENPPPGKVQVSVKPLPGAALPGQGTNLIKDAPSSMGEGQKGVSPKPQHAQPFTTFDVGTGKQTFNIPLP